MLKSNYFKCSFILILLLIIPLFFFFWGKNLHKVSGPNYITTSYRGQHFDPEYAYLFNSLNIINGIAPWHIDHPGTPLQMLGAMVIKASHPFTNSKSITGFAFTNPEIYLTRINFVINILIVLTIFVLGIATYFVTENIFLTLIMQLSPLFSLTILASFSRVSPEPILLIITLLLAGALISLLKFDLNQHLKTYLALFSIIIGLGIALKISFLPLAIIPGILFWKRKKLSLYLLGVLASFVIFTLPIIFRYKSILAWTFQLSLHEKKYGKGALGIVDPASFLHSFINILTKEWIFSLILLICLIFLLTKTFAPKKLTQEKSIEYYLILGCVLAQLLQIIIVSKHYNLRYMLPAFSLSGAALVFLLSDFLKNDHFKKYLSIIGLLIFMLVFMQSYQAVKMLNNIKIIVANEKSKIPKNIQLNKALEFGNFWSGEKYDVGADPKGFKTLKIF